MISRITEQLFVCEVTDVLGSNMEDSTVKLRGLEELGITHVVSVCPEEDLIRRETDLFNSAENAFKFHSEPVPTKSALQPNEDSWKKGLALAIDRVAAILAENADAKILVHYIGGIDRSPFIVASIIAGQNKIRLSEAYEIVKKARPIIHEHYEWLND